MVLTRRDDHYEALAADGSVTFERTERRRLRRGREHAAATRSPTSRPTSSSASRPSGANLHPHRHDNAYPFAYDQTAQLFDSPAAPDLCVLHSAAHNWEDQGGHLGEHGSLGIVQARAPMVIGGKGVQTLGVIPRAARLVDTAPTIAALLGCAPRADGTYLAVQDGEPLARRARPVGTPASTSSGSCSTAPTPTCSTTCARAARRRTSRASSRWASRSVTARCRRCRPSRSRTTRRSSPARTRAITASSTTRGSTARPASR